MTGASLCSTVLQAIRAGALFCWKAQKSSYPQKCVKVIVFVVFCGCNGKTSTVCHQWLRWSSPLKQFSYSAAVNNGCDNPVCTPGTLWRQHYITINKEYL